MTAGFNSRRSPLSGARPWLPQWRRHAVQSGGVLVPRCPGGG